MNTRLWKHSAAYRSGYQDGRQVERDTIRPSHVIQIRMADGKVLFCEQVFKELRAAGWRLCPIPEDATP